MSALAQPRLSPEQYLEIERAAACRSEYYNGGMHAMAGGSFRHFQIIGNINGELYNALKKRPCSVGPSDLRVRVSRTKFYTYPDVVIICGEPEFADDQKDTLLNPTLIIEVLSPSTEGHDRGFKSGQYRAMASLQEYALVSQTEPRVEVFRRVPSGWLLTEFSGTDAACHFASLDASVALADIYDKVVFGEEAPPPA